METARIGAAPAGVGEAAAAAGALAAAVVASVARTSEATAERSGLAAQAASLQRRLAALEREDAEAYAAARAARGRGDHVLGPALDRAASVPLRIAQAACDVAVVAATVAGEGDPAAKADAAGAAILAEAAARASALLVEVNLATRSDDWRVEQAHTACTTAAEAVRRLGGPDA